MPHPRFDVAVVGAGPAGSATAIHLARAGVRTILLDKSHFPRPKPCGEGVMPHGVAELGGLGLDVDGHRGTAHHIDFRVSDGSSARGRLPTINGIDALHGFERTDLDTRLVALAIEAGACVREETEVREVSHGRHWLLTTDDGPVEARMLVAADGLRSPLRSRLGFRWTQGGRRRYALTSHVDGPIDTSDAVIVGLERTHEVYLTPIRPDRTLVAVLVDQRGMRTGSGDAAARFDRLLVASPTVRQVLAGTRRNDPVLATGPFGVRVPDAIADGVALVGDAAGFADPISGEGISNAVISARHLATSIVAALAEGEVTRHSLARYEAFRRQTEADHWRLTSMLVALTGTRWTKRRAVANMAERPEIFGRLLAVNCGVKRLGAVSWRDWRALVAGF